MPCLKGNWKDEHTNARHTHTHLIYSFVTIIYWFSSLFSGYGGNLFKINILKLPTVFFDKNMIIKYESHSEIYARMRRRFRYMFLRISFHPSNGRVSVVCFRSHKYRVKLKKTINNSISHCLTAFSKIFCFWVYNILTEFASSSIMLGIDMVAHMSQQPFAIQYPNSNSKDLFLYVALSRFLSFDRRENYIHRWIQNAMRGYSNFSFLVMLCVLRVCGSSLVWCDHMPWPTNICCSIFSGGAMLCGVKSFHRNRK